MGKTILTARQSDFLELASKEDEIIRWYYLTGGTALSEFYLQHRLSEDIDLFSFSEVNDKEIDKIIQKAVLKLHAVNFSKRRISGLFIYQLQFNNEYLKIDFNNYPYGMVERGAFYHQLKIDSFYDISINKLYSIIGRFQTRDFIDLYFILKKGEFNLEQLILRTEEKFITKIDRLYLASQILRVVDLPKAYPKMLKPFRFDEMIEYFKKQAKNLGNRIIKQ